LADNTISTTDANAGSASALTRRGHGDHGWTASALDRADSFVVDAAEQSLPGMRARSTVLSADPRQSSAHGHKGR
jgi:hypothetical protein